MFFTREFQRNPLSAIFGDQDLTYWTSFELELMIPWYVILLKQPESEGESSIPDDVPTISRTIITADIRDVLRLILTQHLSEIKVQNAYLVFPNREKTEITWEMKKIRAAWSAEKNAHDGDLILSPVDYIETEDEKMYPLLHQSSPPESKKGFRMIFSFSQGAS